LGVRFRECVIKSILLLICCLLSMPLAAQLDVVYPNVNGKGEQQLGYAVLKLALEKSGQAYTLKVSELQVNNARIRKLIQSGVFSISDFGSSAEYQQQLQPIPFPIDLGLNGWRVLVIYRGQQARFTGVNSPASLSHLLAGQGLGWADTAILRRAGLKVAEVSSLDNLFSMVERKRLDYLPLGVNEAEDLLLRYRGSAEHLAIENRLLLIYSFARLFFVNKADSELYNAVSKGLTTAFEDGSYWHMFRHHPSNRWLFSESNLTNRLPIYLDNPTMSEASKQIPAKYFLSIEDFAPSVD